MPSIAAECCFVGWVWFTPKRSSFQQRVVLCLQKLLAVALGGISSLRGAGKDKMLCFLTSGKPSHAATHFSGLKDSAESFKEYLSHHCAQCQKANVRKSVKVFYKAKVLGVSDS